MKAVRVDSSGSVSVVELPVPRIGPGEALMRTRVSGICGSDLLDWYVRRKAGSVLGHEVSGEIVEVGNGVFAFSPGDRVVPHHHAPCLACPACRAGRFVHCAAWKASRLDPGGMAEVVRIPSGNLGNDTLKIPPGLSDEEASWTEPLATVVKAFRRGGFAAGRFSSSWAAARRGSWRSAWGALSALRGSPRRIASPRAWNWRGQAERTRRSTWTAARCRPASTSCSWDPARARRSGPDRRRRARRDPARLHDGAAPGVGAFPRRARPLLPRGAGRALLFLRSRRDDAALTMLAERVCRWTTSSRTASLSSRPPPPLPGRRTRTIRSR